VSLSAITLILIAAIAHASWNLFSKQAASAGAVCFVWLFFTAGAVLYAPLTGVVLAVSHPRLSGLPAVFLAGTAIIHIGYALLLQNGYRLGDLSVVYPIGRGTGALLAAVAGIVLLGERPGPLSTAGILLIVAGVMAIGLPGRGGGQARHAQRALPAGQKPRALQPPPAVPAGQRPRAPQIPPALPAAQKPSALQAPPAVPAGQKPRAAQAPPALPAPLYRGPRARPATRPRPSVLPPPAILGIAFALLTGLSIATYTVWDKYAVATLHIPPVIEDWAATLGVAVALAPIALRDRVRLATVWRAYRPQVLGAAVLSPLAYILVLTALRFTAISVAAPCREVSVLFGVLLGRRMLGEGSLGRRLAAAVAIVAGIISVAIG
jgi:drug/metabolite transporter (DMT)-like permease